MELDDDTIARAGGWRPPVNSSLLLDEIVEFVSSYCALPERAADAIALWILHAEALDAFEITPYLAITSAEKRSGKTTLLKTIELLVPRPWRVVQPTEAVLFRKIEQYRPTLLLDETDTVFRAGLEMEGLRALLNAGNESNVTVPRCVGKSHELVDFNVFCAKVLAGIGDQHLPDTVRDRSICISMKRKHSSEPLARFRRREVAARAHPLRERIVEWGVDAVERLRDSHPTVPDQLDDRAADIWEPPFAIAELAGNGWPQRARHASLALSLQTDEGESRGITLLEATRAIFHRWDGDRILTTDLIRELASDEEAPFVDWWDGLTGQPAKSAPSRLAKLLRQYGIKSTTVRDGQARAKGYKREDFTDAWQRYLDPLPADSRDNGDKRDSEDTEDSAPVAAEEDTAVKPVTPPTADASDAELLAWVAASKGIDTAGWRPSAVKVYLLRLRERLAT